MTAQIYDLTASPHFNWLPSAIIKQRLASTAETDLERAAETYFFASVGLRVPVLPVEEHRYLTERLRELQQSAPSDRIRNSCNRRLAAITAKQQQGSVA